MKLLQHPGLLVLSLTVPLAACVSRPDNDAKRCAAALGDPMLVFELFFGRSVPAGGEVGNDDWEGFVDRVVTPALPNGFTVFDATGAWMDPGSSKTIHERTKVLLVALPDAPGSVAAVQRIRDVYQGEYRQKLVGMIIASACGAF